MQKDGSIFVCNGKILQYLKNSKTKINSVQRFLKSCYPVGNNCLLVCDPSAIKGSMLYRQSCTRFWYIK